MPDTLLGLKTTAACQGYCEIDTPPPPTIRGCTEPSLRALALAGITNAIATRVRATASARSGRGACELLPIHALKRFEPKKA